jgi:carboxylesterase
VLGIYGELRFSYVHTEIAWRSPVLKNEPFLLEASRQEVCLLLHGLGGGAYEMQLIGEYLHSKGLSVQAINYPGHDRPSAKMPASSWQDWYGHIRRTYESLASHYDDVHVIGFSTGCPLALHLATEFPIKKLVLLSPFFAIRREWFYLLPPEAYLYSLGRLIDDVPRRSLPIRDQQMRSHAEKAAYFRTFNLPSVRSAFELIDQVKVRLPEICVPTLTIQSPRDSVVDPSGAIFLYDHLGSPTKKLHWLKHSDHAIALDSEREEVFQCTCDFLEGKS